MPKLYTDEAMSAAIADVQNNKLSVRKAAKKYSVPKSSLSDRLTGKIQAGSKWGKQPLFSVQDEKDMIKCATDRAQIGIGFSKPNFIRFAGAMANSKGIKMKNGKPSDMWWRRMKSRHASFSLRSPEPTASIRHDAMSRQRMKRFFEQLGNIVLGPNFKDHPSRIWNMDETGITLSHKPNKVIAKMCDGHGSHNNVEFLELAVTNDIIVVELPSHTSHWTQPFDRTVFKALKSHWNTGLDNFIKTTGIAVGHKQFLKVFNVAWQATMIPKTIKNGFAATGIYPFNPKAIPDEAYAPNEMCITSTSTAVRQSGLMSENTVSNGVQNSVVVNNGAATFMSESPMLGCEQQSNATEVTDLLAMNSENISSVSLSVPLTAEDVILPLLHDSLYGLVVDSSASFSENRVLECTSKEALEVIESTLSSEQKLRFQAALISGSNTKIDNDPLYQSWKHYALLVHGNISRSDVTKPSSVPITPPSTAPVPVQTQDNPLSLCSTHTLGSIPSANTVANQVFPMPKPTKKNRENEYFVMTAEEIVQEKKRVVDMKRKQLEVKQIKREERLKKKIETALKKLEKSDKKKGGKLKV